MALSTRERAMLKAFGKAGDMMARAANLNLDDAALGRAVLVSLGSPNAKGASDVHGSVAANLGKAFLDFGPLTGDLDTVIEATTGGTGGNSITVAVTGDSPGAGGVTISRVGTAFTIHYESGVSTIANVETAINALAGADDLIGIRATGTGATVLTAAGDDIVATSLAGGASLVTTTGFTNPDVPRNLRMVFAASSNGMGNVTAAGTNQFDEPVTETFTHPGGGGGTVVGSKVFKTVTSITRASYGSGSTGANGVTVGTGDIIGIATVMASPVVGLLFDDGVAAAATFSGTYNTVTWATPDNSTITVMINV